MTNAGLAAEPVATYGFGGRLTAAFPSQVVMDLTEVCNLACVHCLHPTFKESAHYGARRLAPELNAKMVDEVRAHGQGLTRYIRYASNGEPLAHPDAYDMIEDAVRRSGVYVTLTTNGTIMNEQRTTRLLTAGVHMIDVSIDAFSAATYARIRRKGDLDVTRANVLRLIGWVREARLATKVVVSFIEQQENAAEAAAFEQYWHDHGADAVIIRRQHTCAGALIDLASLRRDATVEQRRPCLYPWERVLITAGGDLAFCPSDWVHGSTLADYRHTTIREVWQGDAYARLRAAHLTNDYSGHAFCRQCPDWAATRWPGTGRSYADLIDDFRDEDGSR